MERIAMRLHEQIRKIAEQDFVAHSRSAGKTEFAIAVRDLMAKAQAAGISTSGRTPAFCKAIQTIDFLDHSGLELLGVDGPKSKLSTTVVVRYRFRDLGKASTGPADLSPPTASEDPLMRLRGVLKGAMREGAAAFLRELRRDKQDESARDGKRVA
jgi:hypothetical protein